MTAFTVEAYDGESWHPGWDSASEEEGAPGYEGQWPRALRLTLTLEDGRSETVQPFLPVGHTVESTIERGSGAGP